MIPVKITELKRRRWMLFRPRRFSLQLPEAWSEVTPLARRQRWWRWLMTLPRPAATRAMVRDLLPRWVRLTISDLDFAGITMLLDWITVEPDCSQVAIESFKHNGESYHFPAIKGTNTCCIEFALADDYYQKFSNGDSDALLYLVATLWREEDGDQKEALKRADIRVPLHSKAEVEFRAKKLRSAPTDILLQALLYFGGLKAYIHRVYGKWLFEEADDDEDGDDKSNAPARRGPDFGWWGMFQNVAEAGVFGPLSQVYQSNIHNVCIFLVRKRVDNMNSNPSSAPKPADDNDND